MGKSSIFSEISPQDHQRRLRQLEEFSQLDPITQFTVFCLRKAETNRRSDLKNRGLVLKTYRSVKLGKH